ncbi:MAG: hypothetical protein WBA00_17175 [Rhodococcus sp. (in: high G+C Gram-positive bacteria)]
MRRRVDTGVMPADMVVFDGRGYRTEAAWRSAWAVFLSARAAWSQGQDGVQLPPPKVNGHCPFDPSRFRKTVTGETREGFQGGPR